VSDLSTYTRFKDWMLVGAIGIIVALFGVVASDNRRRIELLEMKCERIDIHAGRISSLETAQLSQREETFRRLDRIEGKLDRLQP
jgi:hypothetical protein